MCSLTSCMQAYKNGPAEITWCMSRNVCTCVMIACNWQRANSSPFSMASVLDLKEFKINPLNTCFVLFKEVPFHLKFMSLKQQRKPQKGNTRYRLKAKMFERQTYKLKMHILCYKLDFLATF